MVRLVSPVGVVSLRRFQGDHIAGLVPLMCALLDGDGGAAEGDDPRLTQDGTAKVSVP